MLDGGPSKTWKRINLRLEDVEKVEIRCRLYKPEAGSRDLLLDHCHFLDTFAISFVSVQYFYPLFCSVVRVSFPTAARGGELKPEDVFHSDNGLPWTTRR